MNFTEIKEMLIMPNDFLPYLDANQYINQKINRLQGKAVEKASIIIKATDVMIHITMA